MKHFLFLLILSFINIHIFAHPVIWKDGSVFTARVTDNMNQLNMHHSITNKWATGIHAIQFDSQSFLMIQNNGLIKRWNKATSQANIYAFSGFGASLNDSESIAHLGIHGDWETRRYYTQHSANAYLKKNSIYKLSSRFGIAPYAAEYTQIHTWLIIQCDYLTENDNQSVSAMPVVRLFKDTVLFEFGTNFSSKYLITAMVHL